MGGVGAEVSGRGRGWEGVWVGGREGERSWGVGGSWGLWACT